MQRLAGGDEMTLQEHTADSSCGTVARSRDAKQLGQEVRAWTARPSPWLDPSSRVTRFHQLSIAPCMHWHRASHGALGNVCPLTSNSLFFSVNFGAAQSLSRDFVRLPLETYLYSTIAAAVVQSWLRESRSVHYFASFYVRQ